MVHSGDPYQALSGMVAADGFSVFARVVILAATALGLLVAQGYLRREEVEGPEFHALLLLSASGMLLMTSANDLIVVFLALEILSIALYVLAAFDRSRLESGEAGLKYFVLGAFSSAVLPLRRGHGLRRHRHHVAVGIAAFLAANTLFSSGLLLAGFALILVGLGFKVAAVPFHMWTPDVYQGAPTPVTGFMAAGAKAAGFAALLRVFVSGFGAYRSTGGRWCSSWPCSRCSSAQSLAMVQRDVKRMLAYSSISHAGYVLIGVQAATKSGVSSALFYLLTYTFMVVGAFAVVTVVGRKGDAGTASTTTGVGGRRAAAGGGDDVPAAGQAGIPFTTGFVAKFYVFAASVDAGEYAPDAGRRHHRGDRRLLLPPGHHHDVHVGPGGGGRRTGGDRRRARVFALDPATGLALGVAVLATVVMGVLPGAFIDFARHATLLF